MDPGKIWNSVTTSLLQGVTSIGLNYATQKLDLDPLVANLGYSAIASGIEGLVNGSGLFENMVKSYKENTLSMLGHNPPPDKYDPKFWKLNQDGSAMEFQDALYGSDWAQYNWQNSVYTAQLQDFTDIMKNQGIEAALNTYATGLFNGIAVNSITNVVHIGINQIGTYVKNKLDSYVSNPSTSPDVTKTIKEAGVEEFTISLKDLGTSNVGINIKVERCVDPITKQVYYKFKGYEIPGKFDIYANDWKFDPTYGEAGAFDGYFNEHLGNFIEHQEISSIGLQTLYEVRDSNNEVLFFVSPGEGGTYNKFDSFGRYLDAEISNKVTGMKFEYENLNLGNVVFDHNIHPGENIPSLTIPGSVLNGLLFSKVENGEIKIDKLLTYA